MTVSQQRLSLYLDAEARILKGQAVQLGDRRLQMADLAEVRAEVNRLQVAIAREARAGSGSPSFAQADFGGRT